MQYWSQFAILVTICNIGHNLTMFQKKRVQKSTRFSPLCIVHEINNMYKQNDMCTKRESKLALASSQSDQSDLWPWQAYLSFHCFIELSFLFRHKV